MAGLAVATAAYTVRMSKRVISNRQLPPPGVWVLGKPKVVFGDRAVVFGYVGYGLAAVLSIAIAGDFSKISAPLAAAALASPRT